MRPEIERRAPRSGAAEVKLAPVPRVLVVDDSPVVRFSVRKALVSAGLEVVERDCVSSSVDVAPDGLACAVLDLELGDGLGLDVAERLRAERSELPVAFFSSAGDAALLSRARAFGPVFPKPDGLDEAVAWALSQARR